MVTVSIEEYTELIKKAEAVRVLKDYIESSKYPSESTIKIILGISAKEKHNDNN